MNGAVPVSPKKIFFAKSMIYRESITQAFCIPGDFDDTFVNIGLGALLKQYTHISKAPYKAWLQDNPTISEATAALKEYAYKPFSKEIDCNTIDPRTYFYTRDFLLQASDPLALVATWALNISESKKLFDKNYRIPLNVNNVDLTVCSNVVYGITAAVLAQLEDTETWFEDDDLQMIYENSSALIAWEIERNFSSRPDLALTYYPSVYNFYWFTARTLNLLNSADRLPYPVMERVREKLMKALRSSATESILNSTITDGGYSYFDGFLGDADKKLLGEWFGTNFRLIIDLQLHMVIALTGMQILKSCNCLCAVIGKSNSTSHCGDGTEKTWWLQWLYYVFYSYTSAKIKCLAFQVSYMLASLHLQTHLCLIRLQM